MVGIYKITSPSNKVYIGQSWDIIARRKSHFKDSKRDKFKQYAIYNSIKKYGWDSHSFKVVHELPSDIQQEILDQYEKAYMSFYMEAGCDLLNVSLGGSRGKHSEETKRKIGEQSKKKIYTEEYRAKLREGQRKRIERGEVKRGHKMSEEVKAQMSLNRKGRKFPNRSIENTPRGHTHYNYGKSLSEEVRLKLSKSSPKAIKVIDKDGNIYSSIRAAAIHFNTCHSALKYRIEKGIGDISNLSTNEA